MTDLPPHPHPGQVLPRLAWLSGSAALLLFAGTSCAADFFVSPAGDDASPGTLAAPFKTVQHAAATAQPGDTIHLRAGTYRECVEYDTFPGAGNSGSAGNEIVMTGYQNETATISGFDLVIPGQDGAGTWTQHSANIWKIDLTADWSQTAGSNLVMVDGVIQQEARWPNVPDAFNFDYRDMAFSDSGTVDLDSAGPQPPYPGNDFYTATYTDSDLPALPDGTWTGAMIDLSPFRAGQHGNGVVTDSSGTIIEFRYKRYELFATGSDEPYFLWNNLAALDQPGEAFLDVEGVSGPAHTLYIWSPQGDPELHHQVEVLRRSHTLLVNTASHLQFQRLQVRGGRINCKPNSSFITLQEIDARHAGFGLNLFNSTYAVVTLDGTDSTLRDSYVGHSFGGGVQARSLDNIVENNVIRRCKEYGVGTWGGHNITVNRNTVAENGRTNIAMFSTASQFNFNHCYLAGMRLPDEASMNTNGNDTDRLDTEVAHNWVHDNVGRVNAAKQIGGGRGIRLDSGSGGVYNMLLHHNIVWKINGGDGLVLWALPSSSAAYGNSQIRAYNNTVDGQIEFPGSGSIGGHDLRNNIAERLGSVDHGEEEATIQDNILFNQGHNESAWPGNIFETPGFVSGAAQDFYLVPSSPGIDAGDLIPPVTDGYSGPAPEIGALEYTGPDARVWSAGAIMLADDLSTLTLEAEVNDAGQRQVRIENIPEGRVLPDGFALRIGGVVTHHLAYRYNISTHRATGIVRFLSTPPPEGFQPIALSIDSGTNWTPMGTVHVPPPGVSIVPGQLLADSPAGGTVATLDIQGVISKERLIPVDFVRTLTHDLNSKPVPLVVDTRPFIASGEMNPDGSNIRFRTADRSVELDYWIESGLDSPSTLFWVRHRPGESSTGDQIYLALEDPASPPVSDPTVLTDYFSVLNDPSLCVWYSANSIAAQKAQGDPISQLTDQGPRAHHADQASSSLQPHWNEDQLAGLPTLHFDGNDHLFAGTVSPITPTHVSFVVVYRNDVGTDDLARVWSAGTGIGGSESAWADAGPTEEVWVQKSTRRLGDVLVNMTIGKKATKQNRWFTGDFAELLLYEVELENPGPWERLREFASRRYALENEARGVARPNDAVEPATLFVDGQEVSDFSVLPNGDIQFTIPPASGSPPLPAVVDIDINTGYGTISLSHSVAYYTPNYSNWSAPLVGDGLDDPALDIEGDRIVNLLEYTCDLDPEDPDPTAAWGEAGTGGGGEDILYFYFRRSTTATDAVLLIERTEDLITWTALDPDDLGVPVHDPDPDGDGSAALYRAEFPISPSRFELYRLRAELIDP